MSEKNSSPYLLSHDQVVEGEFVAKALSPDHIQSNYRSPFSGGISRYVDLKFSINGQDNELPFAVNHRMVIRPDESGAYTTPLFVFGQRDEKEPDRPVFGDFLEANASVIIQVDMRPVWEDFAQQGYHTLLNGEQIQPGDIQKIYVAGSREPLTWAWDELSDRKDLELKDDDGDGVYQVTLVFNPRENSSQENLLENKEWKSSMDLSAFPSYQSEQVLVDALYKMSLEEMLLDIREDTAFQAGAKWPGVWTRDISYSILLSLAFLHPEATRLSLLHKVKDGKIIQDTGTGGSWPVSTDRTTWVLASWELYKVTGDQDWLASIFPIIERSVAADQTVAYNPADGLFYGESSFLDWREQSYPAWMKPVDIYNSYALGTNAVMAETYRILAEMEEILEGEDIGGYGSLAASLKENINKRFWVKDKGYYGQFIYPDGSLSERAEALGASLCLLFDIVPESRKDSVVDHMPVNAYGIPCIYPQIKNIPPYHNDAVWPFVQAYWNWAAAKNKHEAAVDQGLAALYRSAALFLTNKENYVASSGDFLGTETNSDRQLWSVAGNLAMVYRVFLGMDFQIDGLHLNPFIPKSYPGKKRLSNFVYRDAVLEIEIEGFGDKVASAKLGEMELDSLFIPADLKGHHHLLIRMQNGEAAVRPVKLLAPHWTLPTPIMKPKGKQLNWKAIPGAKIYAIFRNGELISETRETFLALSENIQGACYQVQAIDSLDYASFLSDPVCNFPEVSSLIIEPSVDLGQLEDTYPGYYGLGYVHLSPEKHRDLYFQVTIPTEGIYRLELHYANGNGPINTENKCAIRSLFIDNSFRGTIVMPQLGDQEWDQWDYSNPLFVRLQEGRHQLRLRYLPTDQNMNGQVNDAHVDYLRLVRAEGR